MPKIECKMEEWWINSSLNISNNDCTLYGDVYGHPEYKDGSFIAVPLLRADFTKLVAETDDSIVKLGEPQSIDRIMRRLGKEVK